MESIRFIEDSYEFPFLNELDVDINTIICRGTLTGLTERSFKAGETGVAHCIFKFPVLHSKLAMPAERVIPAGSPLWENYSRELLAKGNGDPVGLVLKDVQCGETDVVFTYVQLQKGMKFNRFTGIEVPGKWKEK